jgi:hypothetical protein
MKKIRATTAVICPIGTPIDSYQDQRPKIGETFDIHHVRTKKIVQRARVTGFDQMAKNYFHVRAVIVETL